MPEAPPMDALEPAKPSGPIARTCTSCGGMYPPDFSVCPRDATPLIDRTGAAEDPLLGVVLAGCYRIVRVVGEGGMARLYEAEHIRMGKRCAIKVIHNDLAKTPDLVARFEREAKATSRIQNDHVVRVLDVVATSDGRPCIVEELLEGEDLQAHLEARGKLAPRDAIPIARQICRALDAAHRRGVVHRDLKPSNVFLCRDGDELMVKVLDFGVAKLADAAELTQTGAVVGTPTYMAPEQAKRASEAGPLSDVYSVGAILYRMVTGEPPYGKDPPVNPLMLLLYEEPARPREIEPTLPEGIEAVIQHAMARDPAARPRSVTALDAELAAFDPSSGPVARALNTAAEITRNARRVRPMSLVLAVSSVLVTWLFVAGFVTSIIGPGSGTERALVAVLATVAAGVVAWIDWRFLRTRWRSGPAMAGFERVVRRTVLAGLSTLGALELVAHGGGGIGISTWVGGGTRLAIALAAAALVGIVPWLRERRKAVP
jgi:eukaryotic-like serine/threonine-protein kinase